jgi:hypothetical protein
MYEDEDDEIEQPISQERLIQDLNILIKYGMVDYEIDDDGEWVYKPSEKALRMTQEEQIAYILSLPEDINDLD